METKWRVRNCWLVDQYLADDDFFNRKIEKDKSSEQLDTKIDELLRYNVNKSADSNSQSDASIYSDVSLPGYKSPLPGVGGLNDHSVENMMKKIEEEANDRVSHKKRSPQR